MEKPLLNDPQIYPSDHVLLEVMNDAHTTYQQLIQHVTNINFEPHWNYYNDGKAWLCKVCCKKKTIFWLSVWPDSFNVTFYFTEKNCSGLFDLDISPDIMTDFTTHPPIGKLKPLTIKVRVENQLKDILAIAEYKNKLK